jgi:hypothetical protein
MLYYTSILTFFDRLQTQNHTFSIIEASAEPRSISTPSVNIDRLIVLFGLHLRRALVRTIYYLRKLQAT